MRLLALIPVRLRLTLAFLLGTSLLLLALGVFLHHRLAGELEDSTDRSLALRAGDISTVLLTSPADGLAGEADDDAPAQVIDPDGSVAYGPEGYERRPILTAEEVEQARDGRLIIGERDLEDAGFEDGEDVRVLAQTADEDDPQSSVIVVTAQIESDEEALESLDRILRIGLPLALLLSALIGFFVAGRALRPVARLRRGAEEIGAGDLSERLPEPPARDEIRALAQTLNAMLGRLDDAFARERGFVADASHELRTPLATLKAELDLASRPGRSAEDLYEAIGSAAEETDRLVRLAEDLLVVARADQGGLPVRRETVSVAGLLHAVAGDGVIVDADPALQIQADPLRLQQALTNLLDNARRHGAGAITAAAARDGDAVVIHVRDEGEGFSPEFAARAFERFTRADEARERGGAGLGLPIVAAIAEAHGGSAGIAPGGPGADVWLRLPVDVATCPGRSPT